MPLPQKCRDLAVITVSLALYTVNAKHDFFRTDTERRNDGTVATESHDSGITHKLRCSGGRHYAFKEYVPSEWEAEWLKNGDSWREEICQRMVTAKDKSIKWMEDVVAFADGPNYAALQNFDPKVWSRFVYVDVCADKKDQDGDEDKLHPREFSVYIDPVVGLMRHPLGHKDCVWPGGEEVHVESKDYLAPVAMTPSQFRALYPGKAYLFDLGMATEYGSSLKWLVDEYDRHGIEFDAIYGWEMRGIPQEQFWADADPRLVNKLHVFNTPVSTDLLAVGQAFQVLSSIWRQGDFVVLKLDIDQPPQELESVRQLRDEKGMHRMVSEMWFEMHHDAPEMVRDYSWSRVGPYSEALQTFNELRSLGIRLHTWP